MNAIEAAEGMAEVARRIVVKPEDSDERYWMATRMKWNDRLALEAALGEYDQATASNEEEN